MMRRRMLAATVVAVALVLTGCAGLPESGQVYPGQAAEDASEPPDLTFLPGLPQQGATPVEIVEGFLRAGVGPTDTWERAKQFLTEEFREVWNPEAGVTIDIPGGREVLQTDPESVSVSLRTVATVDDTGAYRQSDGGSTSLNYRLEQQDDGEWRISEGPDGIVLDRGVFTSVFRSYSLVYFDPGYDFLVPDTRWFPTTATTATRIADALVNRPVGEWLDGAVVSAFPEGVTIRPSVPVSSNVAQVELSEEALSADAVTIDRMLTQLEASLNGAGVTRVELSVGDAPLDASTVRTASTRVFGPALVLTEEGFGLFGSDGLTPVEGLSEAIPPLQPSSIQTTADRQLAAVRTASGVARVGADATVAVIDERPGLINPTIDPSGTVWTVPQGAPDQVHATLADGTAIDLTGALGAVDSVVAMSISRDGTRMAAVVTAGGLVQVRVHGVLRDADEVPVGLGDGLVLAEVSESPIGLAWLDDSRVGVLSATEDGAEVTEVQVSGPASTVAVPVDADSIAGNVTAASVRLRSADGALLARRGGNWQQIGTGVWVLATQQGVLE